MNRGMMIQCGGCGFTRSINLNGDAAQIETELNQTIAEEGWRYVNSWDDFICPRCRNTGLDPFYEAYAGKQKPAGKTKSYAALLGRAAYQLQMFVELERL
ncbi:MAG: hypothetical protein K6C12_00845 [Oscillospiraceae bacterium]|nr:hypothetical protein [Oscillospiraceae bacterium]